MRKSIKIKGTSSKEKNSYDNEIASSVVDIFDNTSNNISLHNSFIFARTNII